MPSSTVANGMMAFPAQHTSLPCSAKSSSTDIIAKKSSSTDETTSGANKSSPQVQESADAQASTHKTIARSQQETQLVSDSKEAIVCCHIIGALYMYHIYFDSLSLSLRARRVLLSILFAD
jgi:hypothetical protein